MFWPLCRHFYFPELSFLFDSIFRFVQFSVRGIIMITLRSFSESTELSAFQFELHKPFTPLLSRDGCCRAVIYRASSLPALLVALFTLSFAWQILPGIFMPASTPQQALTAKLIALLSWVMLFMIFPCVWTKVDRFLLIRLLRSFDFWFLTGNALMIATCRVSEGIVYPFDDKFSSSELTATQIAEFVALHCIEHTCNLFGWVHMFAMDSLCAMSNTVRLVCLGLFACNTMYWLFYYFLIPSVSVVIPFAIFNLNTKALIVNCFANITIFILKMMLRSSMNPARRQTLRDLLCCKCCRACQCCCCYSCCSDCVDHSIVAPAPSPAAATYIASASSSSSLSNSNTAATLYVSHAVYFPVTVEYSPDACSETSYTPMRIVNVRPTGSSASAALTSSSSSPGVSLETS